MSAPDVPRETGGEEAQPPSSDVLPGRMQARARHAADLGSPFHVERHSNSASGSRLPARGGRLGDEARRRITREAPTRRWTSPPLEEPWARCQRRSSRTDFLGELGSRGSMAALPLPTGGVLASVTIDVGAARGVVQVPSTRACETRFHVKRCRSGRLTVGHCLGSACSAGRDSSPFETHAYGRAPAIQPCTTCG